LQDPVTTVSSVDSLEHLPEIAGAVAGVFRAGMRAGLDASQVRGRFQLVHRNSDYVRALLRIDAASLPTAAAENEIQAPPDGPSFGSSSKASDACATLRAKK